MPKTILERPAAALAFAALLTVPAIAQNTPSSLADLVGARGSSGEGQLQARGYSHVKTQTSGDSKYSYWWNAGLRQCISVRTSDGRYSAIVATLPADCGHNASVAPAPMGPPEIIMGRNGEGEVIFKANNCVAYYNSSGHRNRSGPSCTSAQLRQADDAMTRHRREQGMSGPVASHSPVYRDFTSNRINLICHGDGSRLTYTSNLGYVWDDNRQRYIPQSIPGYGREEYDTYLTIQLDGNRGRIRLPASMVPPIHSGEARGWRNLSDIRYTRTQIKAKYKLNALNHPNVTLNRRSGRINISGQRGFNGNCVALDRGRRW